MDVMSNAEENPVRQFVAAAQAAAAVAAEWAERTGVVTAEALQKLNRDPAIRALLESFARATVWGPRACGCICSEAHPDDPGVCDRRAVITRRLPRGSRGLVDVPLCAPCAVAQGVAEMPT